MTEAERAFASLHLRVRVVLAIAILAFVGIVDLTGSAGPDIPARTLAAGVALLARYLPLAPIALPWPIAMTSERPYRAALRPTEALGLLIAASERAFDPRVVEAFVRLNSSGALGPLAGPAG